MNIRYPIYEGVYRILTKKRGKTAGKGEKTKGGKGKGKGWNRPDRQGHGGTHSRTEEKEKL